MAHSEPEVQELIELFDHDLETREMIRVILVAEGVNTIRELFNINPDLVFEIHDEIMSIKEQSTDE